MSRHRFEFAILIILLLAAASLRFWRLDQIPPGYTHDEAGHGQDAISILEGARPIYQTVGYGREPLYDYVVAGLMGVVGTTGLALRLTSALAGIGALLLTYGWVREAFDVPTALATLAVQATAFWPLVTSRQGLRSSLLPLLFVGAVWAFWQSLDARMRTRRWHGVIAGVSLGAALYTYMPARILWVTFPLFLLYLAWQRCPSFGAAWRSTLVLLLVAFVLFLPLFVYLLTHPEAEQRLAMLNEPLDALLEGDASVLLGNIRSAVAGLIIPGQGDTFLAYNIPGRPLLGWVYAVLFVIGLAVALIRWRDAAHTFALVWLVVGLSPALVTGATASVTRAIGALPPLFLVVGLGAATVPNMIHTRWGVRASGPAVVVLCVLVVLTGLDAAHDYFEEWGESPHVRAAYQHTQAEMARYAGQRLQNGAIAVSSIYPQAPHDPYVFDLALNNDDIVQHWFDARRALLLPAGGADGLLVPSSAQLDPLFETLPGLSLVEQVTIRADDLDPFFLVYAWNPTESSEALLKRVPAGPADPALPANFGDALQLLGYSSPAAQVEPGGSVELVTLWHVSDLAAVASLEAADTGGELVLFTHLLDEEGRIVGQEDRLDAPTWGWGTGDLIVQIHRFSFQKEVAPGVYAFEVGAYQRQGFTRLPVLVAEKAQSDRVLIPGPEVLP
jgi:4-amino-4-deoxy-L-arabinose transferase-like glycosyltransferase